MLFSPVIEEQATMRWRTGMTLWAIFGMVALSGCGGGSTPSVSSSSEQVQVKGTVMVNGKRLTKGTVQFDASNINRRDAPTGTFEISSDGTYSGTTLIGENAVSVQSPEIKSEDLKMNRQEFILTSGENVIDISIP
jgi:hypothetical protein